jgi:tetraacyldisaccharide 4'-kinase
VTLRLRAPDFWGRPIGPLALALAPLGALYGSVARARLGRAAPHADLPTIAIGGLTLGGDGKTPAALALARTLLAMGERPAFLTRGYGRAGPGRQPLRVDPTRHGARDVGDEALLLAALAPTYVGADRAASARLAGREGATALLLDDGLHSRSLQPDLAVLVVDAGYGAGNGLCPPAGPLRAPLAAQLACADVAILIGEGESPLWLQRVKTLLRGRLAPDPAAAARLAGTKVFAFAGIGRPRKFVRSLEEIGAQVVGERWFADHHPYSQRELAALAGAAKQLSARLVTTEKDARRLRGEIAVETLPVRLELERTEAIEALLLRRFSVARAAFSARALPRP